MARDEHFVRRAEEHGRLHARALHPGALLFLSEAFAHFREERRAGVVRQSLPEAVGGVDKLQPGVEPRRDRCCRIDRLRRAQ
jgi:hypothetical protein